MFFKETITKWESHRDSRGRVPTTDRLGRYFVLNSDRISHLTEITGGCRFRFIDNPYDIRENYSNVESSTSFATFKTYLEPRHSSKFITLTVYRENKVNRSTYDIDVLTDDISFAWSYNPDPDNYSWVYYRNDTGGMMRALCDLSLDSLLDVLTTTTTTLLPTTTELAAPDGSPSNLVLTVVSDTEISATVTEGATNADGFSWEYSTDDVTYSEHGTSLNGSYSFTGLSSYTIYYFRCRAYKGTNYSSYTSVRTEITNAPAVISAANLVAWFKYDDTSKFTCYAEDNNTVLNWLSSIGSVELIQADHTKAGVWWPDGVYFNGSARCIKTGSITLNQPTSVYLLIKQSAWNSGRFIMDGDADATGTLYQSSTTPGLKVSAGTLSSQNNNATLNTWVIIRIQFNGANGKFRIDETAEVTGNFGANNMSKISFNTAGATANLGTLGLWIKEAIFTNIADGDPKSVEIYNYLVKRKNIKQYTDGYNRFFVPEGFNKYSKVILYVHGHGEDEDSFMHSSDKHSTKMKFIAAGFGVIECLAGGNNWGNQASLDDYNALITWAKGIVPFTDLNIYAQSMGGLPGMQLFMADTTINKFIGIYPALNLANMFTTAFKAAIKTAFGFVDDADYATATAGHDPMLLSGANLNDRKIELVASPNDVTVTKADNTDAFNTAFGSLADITVVVASGVHGDPSHFDGDRDVTFLNS